MYVQQEEGSPAWLQGSGIQYSVYLWWEWMTLHWRPSIVQPITVIDTQTHHWFTFNCISADLITSPEGRWVKREWARSFAAKFRKMFRFASPLRALSRCGQESEAAWKQKFLNEEIKPIFSLLQLTGAVRQDKDLLKMVQFEMI